MKKIACVFLTLAMLFLLATPVFAAGGNVSLAASEKTLNRGDTFTVTATLSGAEAIALGTVKLEYDTDVFEMTGGSCHVSGASLGQVIPAQRVGTFMLSGDPVVISGKIFTFQMKVKDTAGFGDYTISSNASVGVSTGSAISSGSVKVSIVCSHSYGNWTVQNTAIHQQTCSICADVKTEEHSWDDGTITKAPDCDRFGEMTYTCTICSGKDTQLIPYTGKHSYGEGVRVDDFTHRYTCTVCGTELTVHHSWDSGTVTKKPDCKETGESTYTCTVCSSVKTEILPVTSQHSYGVWNKVDDSTHTHTCTVCGKSETKDHSWNRGTVITPATCKGSGEKAFTCTDCGATKTQVLPQLTTHTYSHGCDTECNVCGATRKTSHRYAPDWSKDASGHWHACSECGNKKDTAAHVPGPAATETTAQTCTDCGYVIQAELGHTHSYAETWTSNEAGHWYACSGCEEPGSYTDHSFENACDGDCAICGYERMTTHSYAEAWQRDEAYHWHSCSVCGETADEAAHVPGPAATETTAQTCTDCGYEIAPALGGGETQPTETTEDTVPIEGDDAERGGFPWWILLVAAAAIAGGGALIAGKKKP